MKRPLLVIASVLKPVNDTRMFEKIGHSLGQTNKYDINIIGFPAKNARNKYGIKFFELGFSHRLSLKRFFAPFNILIQCIRMRPKVLFITTHELIFMSLTAKLLTGCRVIYDVQENYALNLTTQNVYPVIIRNLLALWVRGKEWLSRLWVDHYLLAEAAYAGQLAFTQGRFTVLQNKALTPEINAVRPPGKAGLKLLFTGTVSEHSGIRDAVRLADSMHQVNADVTLHIEGYCAQDSLRAWLEEFKQAHPFITSSNLDELADHTDILKKISQADVGLVAYKDHPSNRELIPTKLFEYIAHQLPVLISAREEWEQLCGMYPAGIVVDYEDPDVGGILKEIESGNFYVTPAGDELVWRDEGKMVVGIVEAVMSDSN